jgi:serine/threonine protein phosphatase PrpC
MCAEQTTFKLRPGDFVILLSDGAEPVQDGALVALLSEKNFENAAVLCDRIFALAREGCAGQDDLSVSVVRVMNAK